jgi:hypothetical protein
MTQRIDFEQVRLLSVHPLEKPKKTNKTNGIITRSDDVYYVIRQ